MDQLDDKTLRPSQPREASALSNKQNTMSERFKGPSYEGFSLISKGGMGTILRTTDINCSREVAMKMALNSEEGHESLMHLLHEARVTANLEHPNIVPVHEISCDDQDNVYFTMKLVHGEDLDNLLTNLQNENPEYVEKYTLIRLLEIFNRICDGVAFAHSKGVIHRDLKPENIMVGEFGEVLIMDWGIAKLLNEKSELDEYEQKSSGDFLSLSLASHKGTNETQSGEVFGTPDYMAPEQILGKIDEIDHKTDIYALGGILYKILTLRVPVVENDVVDLFKRVVKGDFKKPVDLSCSKQHRLPHIHGAIPEALSAVAMKALSVDKKDRYESVEQVHREIIAYESGYATDAQEATKIYKLSLMFNRNVIFVMLILFIVSTAILSFYKDKKAAESSRELRDFYEDEFQELKMQGSKSSVALSALYRRIGDLLETTEDEMNSGKFDVAADTVKLLEKLELKNGRFHYLKGRLFENDEKFAEAVKQYEEAVEKSPRLKNAQDAIERCKAKISKQ